MPDLLCMWEVPLGEPPEIVYTGISRHDPDGGPQRYQLKDQWSLHLYTYDGILRTGGKKWDIRKGCISLIPPNTVFEHTWLNSNSVHFYSLFRLKENDFRKVDIPLIQYEKASEHWSAFDRMAESVHWYFHQRPRAVARLWDFLLSISVKSSESGVNSRANHVAVVHAVKEIERNLHLPLRVGGLARLVGLSHNQLTRLFQQAFGMTVVSYISMRRWERARKLLEATSIPLKQISCELGFTDLSVIADLEVH